MPTAVIADNGCGLHRVRDGMNGASWAAATRSVAWGNGEVRRTGENVPGRANLTAGLRQR